MSDRVVDEYLRRQANVYITWVLAALVAITGFDRLQVSLGGDTAAKIRWAYAVYVLAFLIIRKYVRFRRSQFLLMWLFAAVSFCGTLESANVNRSYLYLGWVVFSFVVVFGLFEAIARRYPCALYRALLLAFRLQIVIGVLVYVFKIGLYDGRVDLLYYEPSYFGLALVIYAAMVVQRGAALGPSKMAMDVCLLVVAVFITKSTMLMVGLCVVLVVSPFLSGITLRRVATVIAILVCSLAGSLVYANHSNDLLASTIRGAYQSPDVMEYLMGRGANRVPRMRAARDVFLEHEWMGVGIGAYESAIRRRNMSAYSAGQWWISVADQPAVNIYLELLATTGLLGAAPMFGFFARTLMLSRLRSLDYIQRSYLLACVCLLIMLNFDSNYLRPYLWMILGVYSGSVGPSAVVARRDIERSEQDSMDKARERGGSE